jgi:glycosyltransferase involved in cell wall biosynthesis
MLMRTEDMNKENASSRGKTTGSYALSDNNLDKEKLEFTKIGKQKLLEITIPVYNEEETIFSQIEHLYSYLDNLGSSIRIVVLIADNGSTDKTPLVIEQLQKKFIGLKSLRTEKPGVGNALKISWRESSADYVGYMDLDFSTSLEHLKEVINILNSNEAEIVAGSRWLKGSVVKNRSIKRGVSSYTFNKLMQHRFTGALSDSMCGFKFMKKSLFDKIDTDFEMNDEWFFSAELMIFADLLKRSRVEIPVLWNDDKNSKVKIPRLTIKYLKAMSLLEKKIAKFKFINMDKPQDVRENIKESHKIEVVALGEDLNTLNLKSSSINTCEETIALDSINHPFLILGTANWGITVDKETAYKITQAYYQNGFSYIDTSINYPIDKNQENFSMALSWLYEFRKDFPKIKVYVKVCSATNEGDENHIINASYLELLNSYLEKRFESNYLGLGIHWDNRENIESTNTDQENIITLLEKYSKKGLIVGLSGVKKLSNYNKGKNPWLLQIKYGASDTIKIRDELRGVSHIYAYGVWKSTNKNIKDKKNNIAGLDSSFKNDVEVENLKNKMKEVLANGYCGVMFGVSSKEQLKVWLESYASLMSEIGMGE